MPIALPTTPGIRELGRRLFPEAATLTAANGGADMRIDSPGARWEVDFRLPPIHYADSLAWEDLQERQDTLRIGLPSPRVGFLPSGSPVINGANQQGSVLNISGLNANYVIAGGRWLSFPIDGQIYVYRVRQDTAANGSGQAAVPIRPILRRSPANNTPVALNIPVIEGFATLAPGAFTVDVDGWLRNLAFTIREVE